LASQQRFEGPVLEDLLDRVRAEAGPGAQIVAANRVRKGGLGGFFAKEYYEVVVDVADEANVVVELAREEADAIAPAAALPAPSRRQVRAAARAAEMMADTTAPETGGTRRVPASILDLAEAVNDDERHGGRGNGNGNGAGAGAGGPVPGTPAAQVDAVNHALIDLVGEHGPGEDGVAIDEDGDELVVDGPPVGTPTRFAAILERLSQQPDALPATRAGATEPAGIAAEVRERMAQQAESARRTATAARVSDDPVDLEIAEDREAIGLPTAFGAGADVAKPSFRQVPRREAVLERPENLLAKLGLPARLVPRGASRGELRGALIQSLSELPAPAPVPAANGVVIAVVGTGASAVLLARELCDEYGLDQERIVLATQQPLGEGIPAWLQICDGATAEERRRSWRRRSAPTIVAVSLPPGRDALPWARDLLDRLEPTIAWSMVDAGWKSEDARDWIERLGGVDNIALTDVDRTVSPAAILELGLPVGRIEGRPATAIEWAELLLARMS
jgi:hypothetical protein